MAHYFDGFVTPVPKKNLAAYRKSAKIMAQWMKKNGAIDYVEAVADDVKTGKWTSFPQSVKKKPNETIMLSWVVYKNKSQRNSLMKKMMKDPIFQNPEMMPFDGKRMIYGGFKSFLEMP